ncbi:MAG: fumarylacetoacetate hydrolase family protein, partial [Saprospiraceae bacterium]|nr:fumarylacetoacetate hydrolase family protein [Saprospiraceae bacterium]
LVNNNPLYYPTFTTNLHYELEIVVMIAKNGRHIQPTFASDYVKEVALGIDFTARDLQQQLKSKGKPWELAKGFDGSAAISSFIPIEQVNRGSIEFELLKNGDRVQYGNSKNMLFSIEEIIVFVSQFFKLQMGDLIFTGTPAGVGPVTIGDCLHGRLHTRTGITDMLECTIK